MSSKDPAVLGSSIQGVLRQFQIDCLVQSPGYKPGITSSRRNYSEVNRGFIHSFLVLS